MIARFFSRCSKTLRLQVEPSTALAGDKSVAMDHQGHVLIICQADESVAPSLQPKLDGLLVDLKKKKPLWDYYLRLQTYGYYHSVTSDDATALQPTVTCSIQYSRINTLALDSNTPPDDVTEVAEEVKKYFECKDYRYVQNPEISSSPSY